MFTAKRECRFRFCVVLISLSVFAAHIEPASSAVSIYPIGTTIQKPGRMATNYPYAFYTVTSKEQNRVVLVDMAGNEIHHWYPRRPGKMFTYAEPLNGGHILVLEQNLQDFSHALVELDWDGNIVWEYQGSAVIHHDFERLENGNTLILCYEWRVVPGISPVAVRDDFIIEVNPAGRTVWSWYTSDHFEEFGFSSEAGTLIAAAGKDWAHTNSIQAIPENDWADARFSPGNILVSQRSTNVIFVIDKRNGDIVYQIGPDSNITIGQHDVRMIAKGLPGSGNLLMFDNGGYGGYPTQARVTSRIIELNPVARKIAWKYDGTMSGLTAGSFFSAFQGSVQRLPNGNTMIDEGMSGRFFEVTPSGEIVWEYVYPYLNIKDRGFKDREVYRVWRVPAQWGGLP